MTALIRTGTIFVAVIVSFCLATLSQATVLAAGTENTSDALMEAEASGIDIANVIETVRHHISPAGENDARLAVDSRLYRAEFGPSGFTLTLREKVAGQELAWRTAAWRAIQAPFRHDTADRFADAPVPLPAEALAFAQTPGFGIAVADLRRGERVLPLALGPWRSEYNEASRQLAPGIMERVTAREGNLEWDVLVSELPDGEGALRIVAVVNSAGDVQRLAGTDAALRWPVGDGRNVRMGALVVIDAAGQQVYRSVPQARDGRVILEVPDSVLASAEYPLTLDPLISPEYPVSEPVYLSPPPGSRKDPAVAFNRDAGFDASFLVVWTDSRLGSDDIFAARVSPDGVLLDPAGIAVSTAPGSQTVPRAASHGFSFLIVWQDGRSGIDDDIYGARVSSNGFLVSGPPETGGILIADAAGNQRWPAVTFNSEATVAGYLVVWSDRRNGSDYDLFGTRLNNAGTVFGVNGFPISTAPDDQASAGVSSSGDESLVVWTDYRGADADIYAARVSEAGTLLATDILISTAINAQTRPRVATQPGSSPINLVVWQDQRSPGSSDIYGARVGPFGILLDGPPATGGLPISTATGSQTTPTVAWGSGDFLVVWNDGRITGDSNIYGARVTNGGGLLDGPPATGGFAIAEGDDSASPAIGSDPSSDRYLVVWNETIDAGRPIRGARVSHAGVPLDGPPTGGGFLVTPGANEQTRARLASDGNNYFVVWEDLRKDLDVYGARLTAGGTLLDAGGIPIATSSALEQRPVVSWNGSNYLVVWSRSQNNDTTDIHGTRVSPAGALLDGAPDAGGIAIADDDEIKIRPDVAWDGTKHLVVWEAYTVTGFINQIYSDTDVGGRFVAPDGTVSDISLFYAPDILRTFDNEWHPAVTSDGSIFLLVWSQCEHPSSNDGRYCVSPSELNAQRLTSSGVPFGDQTQVSIYADWSDVDWSGTNYLVAWRDTRFDSDGDVTAARLGQDATLLDGPYDFGGIAVCIDPAFQSLPVLAWNGASYIVVWSDWRTGIDADLAYARINVNGQLLDGPAETCGVPLVSPPHNDYLPDVIATSDKTVLSYARETNEPQYTGVERVFLRTIDFSADLSIEKFVFPDPAAVGGEVTYPIAVRNDGPTIATGVTVTDVLPAGVSFVSATPDQGSCSESGGVVTCDLGDCEVGCYNSMDIVVVANTTGTLTNTASVSSNEPDPDGSDNSATRVSSVIDGADVGVTKTDAIDPVLLGDTIAYTVIVTNHGPGDATGVQLEDFAQGAIGNFATSQGFCFTPLPIFLQCVIGDLAAGASVTVTLETTAGIAGTLLNVARVSASTADPDPANDEAEEQTSVYDPSWADIAVNKVADPVALVVGETVTYTIDVTNHGPGPATGVELYDTLPPEVDPLSATPSQGSCSIVAGPEVTCALGTIAADASATVQIIVTVMSGAGFDIVNTVSVSAIETDPVTGNDSASAFSTVYAAVDSDNDGAWDFEDNCLNVANGPLIPDAGGYSQRDTDEDGIGNVCDADIADPNDCLVNFSDLGIMRAVFLSAPAWPDADFNGDDTVNFLDLAIMVDAFLAAPGPSGLPNACD